MIKYHKAAGYPAVAIASVEERRLINELLAEIEGEHEACTIASIGGRRDAKSGDVVDPNCAFAKAFAWCCEKGDRLLIVLDWNHLANNPAGYRPLKDSLAALKSVGSMVILIAPSWKMPPELEHDVPVLEHSLPTRADLRKSLDVVSHGANVETVAEELAERCCDAAGTE